MHRYRPIQGTSLKLFHLRSAGGRHINYYVSGHLNELPLIAIAFLPHAGLCDVMCSQLVSQSSSVFTNIIFQIICPPKSLGNAPFGQTISKKQFQLIKLPSLYILVTQTTLQLSRAQYLSIWIELLAMTLISSHCVQSRKQRNELTNARWAAGGPTI
jgi:hypothetical protein